MHENKKCLALQNSSHEKKGQTLEFSFKLPGQIPQTVHKLCFRGIYCKVFFNYLAIECRQREGECFLLFYIFGRLWVIAMNTVMNNGIYVSYYPFLARKGGVHFALTNPMVPNLTHVYFFLLSQYNYPCWPDVILVCFACFTYWCNFLYLFTLGQNRPEKMTQG